MSARTLAPERRAAVQALIASEPPHGRGTGGAASRCTETYAPSSQRAIGAADRMCAGCDHAGHEVGPLTPVRLTFRSGTTAEVEYCATCLSLAELAVMDPGGANGAAGLPTEFVRLERAAFAGVAE